MLFSNIFVHVSHSQEQLVCTTNFIMKFQLLYHRSWCQAVETARSGLNASLFVRNPDTRTLHVNFDPQILELIQEAKYLYKLNLEIPETALFICKNEATIRKTSLE